MSIERETRDTNREYPCHICGRRYHRHRLSCKHSKKYNQLDMIVSFLIGCGATALLALIISLAGV